MSADPTPPHSPPAEDEGFGAPGVPGRPTGFTCPRCGGVLGEVVDGRVVRLRCRTGHAVTPETLAEEKATDVEDALWAAVRALEEKAALAWRLSERGRRRDDGEGASPHRREAHAAERRWCARSWERPRAATAGSATKPAEPPGSRHRAPPI